MREKRGGQAGRMDPGRETARRRRILFVIPSFCGGGAERVLLNLLNRLDRERFALFAAVFQKGGVLLESIPDDVVLCCLNKRTRYDLLKLIARLSWKIYPRVKPDIVVSFIEYANLVAIAARVLSPEKPPVIASERSHPAIYQKYWRLKSLRKWLLKKLYPRADTIVAVTRGVKAELGRDFNVAPEKMVVIHNGVDIAAIDSLKKEAVGDTTIFGSGLPVLIACGNLKRAKNYPLLLRAFRRVQHSEKSRLVILGEGAERASLETLVSELGLQDLVTFSGFQKNPYKYMVRSDIFILSSSWEGFCSVMVEAMACGVPVVATDCPSGPAEIITDEVDGLLVPTEDEGALAEAIVKLIRDTPLRSRLGENGIKRARDFSLDKMTAEYEKVIDDVLTGKSPEPVNRGQRNFLRTSSV